MNLSPEWVEVLSAFGIQATHWRDIGKSAATDEEIFRWARENNRILITQDLDFAQLLFRTASSGPSVVLLRLRNEFDPVHQERVCRALLAVNEALESGAVVVIDTQNVRVRRLPL